MFGDQLATSLPPVDQAVLPQNVAPDSNGSENSTAVVDKTNASNNAVMNDHEASSPILSTGMKADCINALPAKSLQPRKILGSTSKIWSWWAFAILAMVLSGGPLLFGNVVYASEANGQPASLTDAFCDKQATSGVQKKFMVDIHVRKNLSFTQAKAIDVVWDAVIGQGGRFLLGFILAKWVVPDALVWTMERSAVPYKYYANLSFSTISVDSMASIIRLLFKRRDLETTISAVLLLFTISHALAFPTLWSAATSYVNPSVRMFAMPDKSLVPLDSPDLALCFSVEDSRVDWNSGHIELGPTFEEFSVSWSGDYFAWSDWSANSTDYLPFDVFTWEGYSDAITSLNASANFRNLLAYAFSIQGIQRLLNESGWASSHYDTALTGQHREGTRNLLAEAPSLILSNFQSDDTTLFSKLVGWQYLGVGQPETILELASSPASAIYQTEFTLNTSIVSGPGVIPYNSTLWYDNESIALDAPFLKFGRECGPHNGFFTDIGSCVCYQGQPLTYDPFTTDNMYCVNNNGYIWGFTSLIVLIGFCVLMAWILSCVWLLRNARRHSILVEYRRKGNGEFRVVLDLAASIYRDLEGETGAYTNTELEQALKSCEDIGYSVDARTDVTHIGIMRASLRSQPTIWNMQENKLFG